MRDGRGEPAGEVWPDLPLAAWADTRDTLHMWTQVVGKVRLALAPMVNHWWQVPLYVTCRGLTTSPIPYGSAHVPDRLRLHRPRAADPDQRRREREAFAARGRCTVADFYAEVMAALRRSASRSSIWTTPVEVEDPIPFEEDREHAAYDPDAAQRFWRVLVQADRVMKRVPRRASSARSARCTSSGAASTWRSRGSPAAPRRATRARPTSPTGSRARPTRTRSAAAASGRAAAGDRRPVFYAYAYPAAAGLRARRAVRPAAASYSRGPRRVRAALRGGARRAEAPDAALLDFLQSTYEAAADLAGWDRAALERAG